MLTMEMLENYKEVNDKNKDITYLIRKKNGDGWYADELCMLREVLTESFRLFRPMDGKVYTLTENDLDDFLLVGVIIQYTVYNKNITSK